MLQAVKLPAGGLLANALHIVQFASEDAAPLPGEPPFTPLLEHERHAGGRALVAQEARPFRSFGQDLSPTAVSYCYRKSSGTRVGGSN